jgi:Ribosomal protein L11 methylase
MGAQDVICVDIDKKAVEIAGENAAINNVESSLRISNKDATTINEPRNLIIANLTAKLLLKLRPHLTQLLLPEGYMIISGIIERTPKISRNNFLPIPLRSIK